MSKYIYPKVKVTDVIMSDSGSKYNSLTLETTLRKEFNGKWYVFEFFRKFMLTVGDINAKIRAIEDFHSEVYFHVVLGDASCNTLNEDKSQISELDRVRGLIGF